MAITVWGLAVAGFGLTLVLAGRSHPDQVLWLALAIAVLMLVVAGASDAISSVFRQTILQTATPDDMRGRLQGVFIVVVAGGTGWARRCSAGPRRRSARAGPRWSAAACA